MRSLTSLFRRLRICRRNNGINRLSFLFYSRSLFLPLNIVVHFACVISMNRLANGAVDINQFNVFRLSIISKKTELSSSICMGRTKQKHRKRNQEIYFCYYFWFIRSSICGTIQKIFSPFTHFFGPKYSHWRYALFCCCFVRSYCFRRCRCVHLFLTVSNNNAQKYEWKKKTKIFSLFQNTIEFKRQWPKYFIFIFQHKRKNERKKTANTFNPFGSTHVWPERK